MNSGGFLEVRIPQYRDYYFFVLNISVLTVFPQLQKMLEVKVTPFFLVEKSLTNAFGKTIFSVLLG